MNRYNTVLYNWTEITNKLLHNKQELAKFLRFSSGMYKQSFPDAALIYQQNPNATKVATLETWNKLGRLVNRGEHSIAAFGEDSKCKHLFDISQTNGKRIPELWKLTEDLSFDLTAVINEKYGKECKNIQETIAAMAVDNLNVRLPDMQFAIQQMNLSDKETRIYQQSVVSAVRFVVSNRCELDSDLKVSGGINLNAADYFKDTRDLVRFCDLVQKSAKDALLEMEREIVQILRKRREKTHELQTQSDRTVSSRNPVHGQSKGTETPAKADRQMGTNVAGVGENRVPDGGSDIHHGRTVANRSERNRQGSGESLSGTGRAVSSEQSSSNNIQRDSGVGEDKVADDRTSDHGGNHISAENVIVENLISRYTHADFNCRLDSYETAGMVFMDFADTSFDPVQFFNRFHSDRFSNLQAEEIRNIIKAATQNREYVVEPPKEEEPVIMNNEVVKTTELPPLLDEKLINGIMKHDQFFKIKCDEITKFFAKNDNYNKRTEFMKSVFNADYTELDVDDIRVGYKTNKNGLTVWEGSYLSRTKESNFSWDLVQSITADLIERGEYLDKQSQIDEPIFAEPVQENPESIESEPFSQGEQLTLFGDPIPIEQIEKKTKIKRLTTVSLTAPTTDMVNHVLKGGSNAPRSLERIVTQFQKGKSTVENAEFLRKEFGTDGRGYRYSSADYTSAALVAAWFDNDGITIAISNTAFPEGKKAHLSWEQVSKRIGELLENGEYCSQDVIDRAADIELKDIADKLWYLHQDCNVEYFIPDKFFEGGFPKSTEQIKVSMTDSAILQKYIDGLDDLIQQYEKDRDVLRFHFHKPKELLQRLRGLQLERRDFITKFDFKYEPKFFITEDEKDKLLIGGSGVHDGKFRIAEFWKHEHTSKDKIAFLKNEYGIGGSGRSGFNEWHDAKGIKYQKGIMLNPDCEIFMKWNEVAERIDRLIVENRYIIQKDIDERIQHAKYVIKNYNSENDNHKYQIEEAKKILAEYDITLDDESQKISEEITNEFEIADTSQESAVFMDTRDGSFVTVQQVDEGIEYTIYAPDLTPIDGGVWKMDDGIDLKVAATELLAASENVLVEISDYDKFMELAEMNADLDVAKIKANILANIPDEKPVQIEQPKVENPEKITISTKKDPKSGIPFTYHFDENNIVHGGAKSKFKANVEAIQTLRKIENENRYATPEEQAIMAKYVGWGGIPQAFTTDRAAENIGGNLGNTAPTGWENEQQQLRELLTPDEYKAVRASTLTSFYTPPEVIDRLNG